MRVGIIGGTGTAALFAPSRSIAPSASLAAPWGAPSAPLQSCNLAGHEVLFLARHGAPDAPTIPPHRVNYRANVWALREQGVEHVLGINTVGGISPTATPGRLVIPDQLIDYTWGREHSYTGDDRFPLQHVEFTSPFSTSLRDRLLAAAGRLGLEILPAATYGATQGPRLETAAEIDRLERDGCHVVGMTAMPEAGLARELGLSYAICCVVVNRAAGRSTGGLTIQAEIATSLTAGLAEIRRLVIELMTGS